MMQSLSARRAWIEISRYLDGVYFGLSLSARRAWIEIGRYWHFEFFCAVALRKESVDRNEIRIAPIDCIIDVALRKESVDRNLLS